MMEDLKTVVITFGLVALVFLQGSLMYQKKINNEYVVAAKQEQAHKTKTAKLTTSQNKVPAQLNKPQPTQALVQVPVQVQTQTVLPASRQSRAS